MRQMAAMPPYWLSSHLHRIVDEAQEAVSQLCRDLVGLSDALNHLYRSVHRHDPWTCPCSVQHALVELTRSYELSHESIRRHAIELQICFNVTHPQEALRTVEEFLELQDPPFSPHSSVEIYLGQVQRYLEGSPGCIIPRIRRRWKVQEDHEARVNFGHPQFDASTLASTSLRLMRNSTNFVLRLKDHHRGVEAYLRKLFTMLQEYQKLLKEYRQRRGSPDLWPDYYDEDLIRRSDELKTYIWDELWAKASDALHQSRFHTGWKPPGGIEPCWGKTIEDILGPFETWATPKGRLEQIMIAPLAEPPSQDSSKRSSPESKPRVAGESVETDKAAAGGSASTDQTREAHRIV